jgi:serine/threonine-protein phosphatase 4 regulatory subunit 2
MHSNAPFTIQRICELCIRPQEHYKAIGKYLRAIEKTLLVTSTWDSFPNPVSGEAKVNGDGPTTTPLSIGPLSAPTTPIFSPIPFLHSDARSRSKSRSPTRTSPNEPDDAEPAFGRVDELDDPRPGHLSDSPTPISSTTTITTTLQDRFVKGEDQDEKETHGEAEAPNADKTEAETKLENTEEKTEAGKEEKATGSEGGEDKENHVGCDD